VSIENPYSIIIKPSKAVSEYLTEIVARVYKKTNKGLDIVNCPIPHICLGTSFYSKNENFEKDIEARLKTQESFVFNLDKVERFNAGTIYLTSDNPEEIDEIKNFYQEINQDIQNNSCYRPRDFGFANPHLTLLNVPYRQVKKTIHNFDRELNGSIPVNVTEVYVQRRMNDGRWKDLNVFNIGSEKIKEGKLIVNEGYRFNKFSRASLQ
jgi:2'-5' RNA ligase